jgi:hypothetical protein
LQLNMSYMKRRRSQEKSKWCHTTRGSVIKVTHVIRVLQLLEASRKRRILQIELNTRIWCMLEESRDTSRFEGSVD